MIPCIFVLLIVMSLLSILTSFEVCHFSSVGKESAFNAGDPSLIPRLGRSAGEGIDYPLQYSGLNNSMDYEDFIKAFVIQNTFILFSESFK